MARTADGGQTWSTVAVAPDGWADPALGGASLSFIDGSNGWLSVQLTSGSAFSLAALYATHDGGANWAPLAIPVAGPIRFISPATGWVAGGSAGDELYVTHDGGSTWQAQPGLPGGTPGAGVYLYGLPSFQDASRGAIPVTVADAGRPRVEFYTTSDGGATWQPAGEAALPQLPAAPVATAAAANGVWFAVDTGSGALQAVGPGGKSMRAAPGSAGDGDSFAAFPTAWAVRRSGTCRGDKNDPGPAFVCEQHAELVRTKDAGATWEVLKP